MDFVLDYISVNAFWTILLRSFTRLLAVALLGALTHQAVSVCCRCARPRAMAASSCASARCRARAMPRRCACCGSSRSLFGAWIYVKYRIYVRIPLAQQGFWKVQGVFELKEQFATLGLRDPADLLVLLEECEKHRIRQPAQMAHRDACRAVLVHVPGRPDRQQRAGIWNMSTSCRHQAARACNVACIVDGVSQFRHRLRHRHAGDLPHS